MRPARPLLVLLVLVGALPWTGCAHSPRRTARQAPPPVIAVGGLVVNPGPQTLPPEGLTLGEALIQAGGPAPSLNLAPAELLVILHRQNTSYHVSLPLVLAGQELKPFGTVQLFAGDQIEVQWWLSTDLARGLLRPGQASADPIHVQPPREFDIDTYFAWVKQIQPPAPNSKRAAIVADKSKPLLERARSLVFLLPRHEAVTPPPLPDPLDDASFRKWAEGFTRSYLQARATDAPTEPVAGARLKPDWEYLKAVYQSTLQNGTRRFPISVAVQNDYQALPLEGADVVDFERSHPNLFAVLGTRVIQEPTTQAVMVLRRAQDDRLLEFILLHDAADGATAPGRQPTDVIGTSTLVFPGDQVELTPFLNVPLLLANVIAPVGPEPAPRRMLPLRRPLPFRPLFRPLPEDGLPRPAPLFQRLPERGE